jgi:hypothetical protein
MRAGEITDMNVITDARAVGRGVVAPEYDHFMTFAKSGLDRNLD